MINDSLPKNVLLKILPREDPNHKGLDFESLDKVLNELQPNKELKVTDDRQLLGVLHHVLNIQNYEKKEFRLMLLKNARDTDLLNFFKRTAISEQLPSDEATRNKLIEIAAAFKWDNNSETRDFVEVFGYDNSIIPVKIEDETSSERIYTSPTPFKQLKDFQSEIVFEAMKRIDEDFNARFMIQMPTGSGKTRIAAEIVSNFLNADKKRNVVWLADKQELCIQAIESFKDVWQHVGLSNIILQKFWGDYEVPSSMEGSNFMVASLGKVINHFKRNQHLIDTDLIVFDEAHHMAAPQYYKAVKYLSGLSTRVIGLSATPGRGRIEGKQNFGLAKLFWNNIITIRSGDEGPITFLQRKKILAKAEKVKLEFFDPSFYISIDEWRKIVSESEFPESLIRKLASNYIRNLRIIEKLKELGEAKKQVLFFGASVEHSRWLFAIAKCLGYKAAHIENNTPTNYRKNIVKKFKNGEINFVFNYDIFTTGFDAPNIDVVFIARPTKSHVTFLQMIGRGMRGPLMGGTEKFEIIYIEDKVLRDIDLDNLYEVFSDYFVDY